MPVHQNNKPEREHIGLLDWIGWCARHVCLPVFQILNTSPPSLISDSSYGQQTMAIDIYRYMDDHSPLCVRVCVCVWLKGRHCRHSTNCMSASHGCGCDCTTGHTISLRKYCFAIHFNVFPVNSVISFHFISFHSFRRFCFVLVFFYCSFFVFFFFLQFRVLVNCRHRRPATTTVKTTAYTVRLAIIMLCGIMCALCCRC